MARRTDTVIAQEDADIARLEAVNRMRARTPAESDRLADMVMRQKARRRYITVRIDAMKARLAGLEQIRHEMGVFA